MEPLETKQRVLANIARALNEAQVTWAVGASMMLYLRGITHTVHDIDLMVAQKDAQTACAQLKRLGTLLPAGPGAGYRTACFLEFVVDGVDVDMMAGFAIVKDGKTYPCPLTPETVDCSVTVEGQNVPLQSVAAWLRYYTLMGRQDKVQLLEQALAEGRG